MFRKIALQADFDRERPQTDLMALLVVVLLSCLFAGAIVSAMAPHPLPDVTQAALEGGL